MILLDDSSINPSSSAAENPFVNYALPDWMSADTPVAPICWLPPVVAPPFFEADSIELGESDPSLPSKEPSGVSAEEVVAWPTDPLIEAGSVDLLGEDPPSLVVSKPDPFADGFGITTMVFGEESADPIIGSCWLPPFLPFPDAVDLPTLTTCALGEETGEAYPAEPISITKISPHEWDETWGYQDTDDSEFAIVEESSWSDDGMEEAVFLGPPATVDPVLPDTAESSFLGEDSNGADPSFYLGVDLGGIDQVVEETGQESSDTTLEPTYVEHTFVESTELEPTYVFDYEAISIACITTCWVDPFPVFAAEFLSVEISPISIDEPTNCFEFLAGIPDSYQDGGEHSVIDPIVIETPVLEAEQTESSIPTIFVDPIPTRYPSEDEFSITTMAIGEESSDSFGGCWFPIDQPIDFYPETPFLDGSEGTDGKTDFSDPSPWLEDKPAFEDVVFDGTETDGLGDQAAGSVEDLSELETNPSAGTDSSYLPVDHEQDDLGFPSGGDDSSFGGDGTDEEPISLDYHNFLEDSFSLGWIDDNAAIDDGDYTSDYSYFDDVVLVYDSNSLNDSTFDDSFSYFDYFTGGDSIVLTGDDIATSDSTKDFSFKPYLISCFDGNYYFPHQKPWQFIFPVYAEYPAPTDPMIPDPSMDQPDGSHNLEVKEDLGFAIGLDGSSEDVLYQEDVPFQSEIGQSVPDEFAIRTKAYGEESGSGYIRCGTVFEDIPTIDAESPFNDYSGDTEVDGEFFEDQTGWQTEAGDSPSDPSSLPPEDSYWTRAGFGSSLEILPWYRTTSLVEKEVPGIDPLPLINDPIPTEDPQPFAGQADTYPTKDLIYALNVISWYTPYMGDIKMIQSETAPLSTEVSVLPKDSSLESNVIQVLEPFSTPPQELVASTSTPQQQPVDFNSTPEQVQEGSSSTPPEKQVGSSALQPLLGSDAVLINLASQKSATAENFSISEKINSSSYDGSKGNSSDDSGTDTNAEFVAVTLEPQSPLVTLLLESDGISPTALEAWQLALLNS